MKRTRKGFTLVELLIVIAVLGALSASMSGSMGTSTAVAKATAIVNNIATCRAAASVYYGEVCNDDSVSTTKASDFLKEFDATEGATNYINNWDDFAGDNVGNITYAAEGDTGPNSWAVKVTFTNDPDAKAIAKAISRNKGYSSVDGKTEFTVKLMTGKVETTGGSQQQGGDGQQQGGDGNTP